MGRVDGKVVLITGAARGQGRSHALRLAGEGADVIAVDLCGQMANVPYDMASRADLDKTVAGVVAAGRRAVGIQADVREAAALTEAVATAVGELGRLDVVVANAGIAPMGALPPQTLLDVLQVNLNGVINTVAAALPHLASGASVVAIGSVAGLHMGKAESGSPASNPGGVGYGFSKRTLASLVHTLGRELGREGIRVNAVHPTNVDTPMFNNDMMLRVFDPESDRPTMAGNDATYRSMHVLDVPFVESSDISSAVLYLASDEARYVTGQQLAVDAGVMLKDPYPGP
ncbi:MAG: mycofactocin-coupled SDR family oxidoreductase [Aeromicrobium sp.]